MSCRRSSRCAASRSRSRSRSRVLAVSGRGPVARLGVDQPGDAAKLIVSRPWRRRSRFVPGSPASVSPVGAGHVLDRGELSYLPGNARRPQIGGDRGSASPYRRRCRPQRHRRVVGALEPDQGVVAAGANASCGRVAGRSGRRPRIRPGPRTRPACRCRRRWPVGAEVGVEAYGRRRGEGDGVASPAAVEQVVGVVATMVSSWADPVRFSIAVIASVPSAVTVSARRSAITGPATAA